MGCWSVLILQLLDATSEYFLTICTNLAESVREPVHCAGLREDVVYGDFVQSVTVLSRQLLVSTCSSTNFLTKNVNQKSLFLQLLPFSSSFAHFLRERHFHGEMTQFKQLEGQEIRSLQRSQTGPFSGRIGTCRSYQLKGSTQRCFRIDYIVKSVFCVLFASLGRCRPSSSWVRMELPSLLASPTSTAPAA